MLAVNSRDPDADASTVKSRCHLRHHALMFFSGLTEVATGQRGGSVRHRRREGESGAGSTALLNTACSEAADAAPAPVPLREYP
ncbi:hypothetical protein KCP71_02195 [Salmonella enterica subsp. enterica]|nr:hypothetical protein KCP71_02195 [Salmonella enterica subsp. enterica]